MRLNTVNSSLDALLQRREALAVVLLQQFVGILVGDDTQIAPSLAVIRREGLSRTQLAEQCQDVATIEGSGEREEALSVARRVT